MDAFAPAGTPAFAPPPAVRLKNAVTLTNDYIAGTHGRIGMFATLFFGLLDPRTGELAYVNGGHLPPMLIGAGGLKGRLERTGPAVGAWLNADYGVGQAALELGDALFAFTDGLTETANRAGEFFSADALIPLFASDQPLPAALARIQQRIESYAAGEHPADDVTMLAVRRATPHASC
jgi:sigma-B regulation protein RsbU (phosphoserine phosphatase)